MISEVLKCNSTLTEINLECDRRKEEGLNKYEFVEMLV